MGKHHADHVRGIKRAVEKTLGFAPECSCGRSAVVAIQTHPVDACAGHTAAPDVRLVCGLCLQTELGQIQNRLLSGHLGLSPQECTQCGLTIVSLSDIIVRLQPLWVWAD